jgi:septum formation inhibitor-activating ATPase MinD
MMLILNRVSEDRNARKLSLSTEKIENFLKRQVAAIIPTDELMALDAIRKGIPVVASQRDRSQPLIRELLGLAESLFTALTVQPEEKVEETRGTKRKVKMVLSR